MFRAFKITLPADTNYHNLFSLIVGTSSPTNVQGYGLAQGGTNETAITGAIPSSGILPDRGNFLEIQADSGNSGTLTISDRNNANSTGKVLNAADIFQASSNRNSVCFKDYFIAGSASSQVMEVHLEII